MKIQIKNTSNNNTDNENSPMNGSQTPPLARNQPCDRAR